MNRLFLIITLLFIYITSVYAQEASDFTVELQFYRQTYHLNEPIPVMINIINTSDKPLSFFLSPLIYESFIFSLRTPRNEVIPYLGEFEVEMKDNKSSSGEFREIKLLPRESFSRVIDISKWFDIRESGYYYINGIFHQNPDNKSEFIESFNYKIFIKPPEMVEIELSAEEQSQISNMEAVQKLPPYDVIQDLLDAKMKKDWDRFLSHIDSERLIMSFQDYYSAYLNASSGRYRLEIIEDFKKYLTVHWQDRILSYKLVESQIKEDKATVICDVDYKMKLYSYTMEYTFSLYKNHLNQWQVYDYTALKIK